MQKKILLTEFPVDFSHEMLRQKVESVGLTLVEFSQDRVKKTALVILDDAVSINRRHIPSFNLAKYGDAIALANLASDLAAIQQLLDRE